MMRRAIVDQSTNALASRATIRDVAELAGVSLGTVSNFLNDNKPIAPDTRERIRSAIEALQFVPNRALRTMHGGRARAIGYVVSDTPDPFFVEVARGVEDVARKRGLVLVSCNTEGVKEYEKQYITALAEMRVAGTIIMPSFEKHDLPFRALRASGTAIVVLGEWDTDTCSITTDDYDGGKTAAQHLLSLGHRDIAFLGGPGGEHQIENRFRGAQAAVREAGESGRRLQRHDAPGANIADRESLVEVVLGMHPRPTALLCASDTLALTVMHGLIRRGLRVPEDVSIVGFGGIRAAELGVVPLTTIEIPQHRLGETAAQLLLGELEPGHEHQQLVLESRLVVRESTTAHP